MRRLPVALWLGTLALCAWIVVARTSFTADLTAFLPRSTTPAQSLLIAQLRDGIAARMVLLGIEGADEARLAEASRAFARRLADTGHFAYVANGAGGLAPRDRDALFAHRYLLSPAVAPERFSEEGLRAALEETLRRLASPLAPLFAPTVARDPTGEFAAALAPHLDRPGPAVRHGVWFDPGQPRALMLAETRAPGFDLDAQEEAQAAIAAAFASSTGGADMTLLVTGPSVFGVESRAAVVRDAWMLSLVAGLGVTLLLAAVYRSVALLATSLLPVATGILVGVAAVGIAFGSVHGITLGFGATLIGEAADYPTYLLVQRMRGEPLAATAGRIGRTLWLAVLTTVLGSLAMLLSSFTGLAQLGLFLFAGALAAGLVTRYVLPALVPPGIVTRASAQVPAPRRLDGTITALRRARWLVPAALALAAAFIGARSDSLWENQLAALSPVPQAAQQLDARLRAALGAPDVRRMLVVRGPDRESVLAHFEALQPALDELVRRGVLAGYDSPARYLPSAARQMARRAALPEPTELAGRLARASAGLPFRDGAFAPFLADVETARGGPLVDAADLDGTAWGIALRSLLVQREADWAGLAPLSGVDRPEVLAAWVTTLRDPAVTVLDLKAESDAMVTAYRDQSLALAGFGVAVIAIVLLAGLRRPRAVLAVLLPVLAAVVAAAAILVAVGVRLSLLHLVSLLLVVGTGTNYALFFNRLAADAAERRRGVFSVCVASATTLIAFGALALSQTAILSAIGETVVLGAALALVFAAAWSRGGDRVL